MDYNFCNEPGHKANLLKARTVDVDFPKNQYYQGIYTKNQLCLHHTVSDGSNATGDLRHWLSSTLRIATSLIIVEGGFIYKCFDHKYWAHAIGMKRSVLKRYGFKDYLSRNQQLNRESIHIELDSLGPVKANGHSVAYGHRLKAGEIQSYDTPFRGYNHFEKYTDEALEILYYVMQDLCEVYEIPTDYNEDMWDVSKDALAGKPGIWSHTSYRSDKSDCHPQPELIQVIKSL